MLSGFARLVPRLSRTFCAVASGNKGLIPDQDVASVQRVEEELFGRYFGDTDSSDIRRSRRSDARKYNRPKPIRTTTTPLITEKAPKKPNPWGMINLPLHDPVLSKLILDARNPKRTKKQQRMIVEGKRLIRDALVAGCVPLTLLVTEDDHLKELEEYQKDLAQNCTVYRVAQKDLSTWSSLTTSPGIMAIFERPKEVSPPKNCLPITVICDNIREPNNLGSIFRVCAALPCRQVMVMKGCTDPWESKCLRGGSGGQFHIPIEYPVKWEDLTGAVNLTRAEVFLADNKSESRNDLRCQSIDEQLISTDSSEENNIFLVIGGETHGISYEAHQFVKSCGRGSIVNIPMALGVESMNTASALSVILYELRRQLIHQVQ